MLIKNNQANIKVLFVTIPLENHNHWTNPEKECLHAPVSYTHLDVYKRQLQLPINWQLVTELNEKWRK